MLRTARGLLALLALVAVAAVACDDDGGGATDSDTTDAATEERQCEPEPTGEPIKLMTIYEKSEGPAPNPELNEGAVAAADALNCAGGTNGQPYEIIECDTGADANTAAECGRQAVDEGVVALVGNLTTQSGEFLPLMVENQIPSVGLVAAGVADFQSEAAFPITGGLPATSAMLPTILFQEGCEAVGLARIDVAEGAAIKLLGDGALEPNLGETYANDVPVPTGAPDMASYVDAATDGGSIDCVVVALPGQDATNFVIAAKQANPDMKLALISTEPGEVSEALGDDANGIYQAPAFLPFNTGTAANEQFAADMAAAGFCGDDDECTANELSGFRVNSYVSVNVVAQILEGLDEISGPALYQALPTVTGLETGLTPPLQFMTPADVGISLVTRVFNLCEYPIVIEDGEANALTGKFYDPFAGEDCPTPS
jgi:branched-chain amino acid transport system substrate-binding protein